MSRYTNSGAASWIEESWEGEGLIRNIQWNLFIAGTTGTQLSALYKEVSQIQR